MTALNVPIGIRRTNTRPRGCAPGGLLVMLLLTVFGPPAWAQQASHRYVALAVSVTLDTVGPPDGSSPARHVGEIDHLRLVFDADAIDHLTRRVPILNLQHLTPAGFDPPRPDPVRMPMTDAWLDLSAVPYRVHFKAAVTHGAPIVIEFDDQTRRLSIRLQGQPGDIRLAGPYVIDPALITDSSLVDAAIPP